MTIGHVDIIIHYIMSSALNQFSPQTASALLSLLLDPPGLPVLDGAAAVQLSLLCEALWLVSAGPAASSGRREGVEQLCAAAGVQVERADPERAIGAV